MIKAAMRSILVLLLAVLFASCAAGTAPGPEGAAEPEVVNAQEVESTDGGGPEEVQGEEEARFIPSPFNADIALLLTSRGMRQFEEEHAVSVEQERYLAFGAFVLTNNRESARVFALREGSPAVRLLRDFWSVTDREGALEQLGRLANANGQSPVADDLYFEFVLNNRLEPIDGLSLLFSQTDLSFLENVYNSAVSRTESLGDEMLDSLLEAYEAQGIEIGREELIETLVYIQFAQRVNDGLAAYIGARDMLINFLGFTEEELLSLPTLAAWDYGRVAIIARYGVEAGYLQEAEAWEYLKMAADSASEIYAGWREYVAAHILGRALAFGNPSDDFQHMLYFLLNHPESSFQTIAFHAD
ncbi:MAG: DUF1266 domain-containing protein [Oscillospiraceae bacterium]|nr:DUF1266 domain-containing protein [Oscillospiraceae bacterium]